MKVSAIWPAKVRDWRVETPTVPRLAWWKTVENPSMFRRNIGFTASGVTSRGAKPVPPVLMTRSTSGSSTQVRTGFAEAFFEVLDDEERDHVRTISLQRWHGAPDAGRWQHLTNLNLPTAVKVAQSA